MNHCPVMNDLNKYLAKIDSCEEFDEEKFDLASDIHAEYMAVLKCDDEAKAKAMMDDVMGYVDQDALIEIGIAASKGEVITQWLADTISDAAYEMAEAAAVNKLKADAEDAALERALSARESRMYSY